MRFEMRQPPRAPRNYVVLSQGLGVTYMIYSVWNLEESCSCVTRHMHRAPGGNFGHDFG